MADYWVGIIGAIGMILSLVLPIVVQCNTAPISVEQVVDPLADFTTEDREWWETWDRVAHGKAFYVELPRPESPRSFTPMDAALCKHNNWVSTRSVQDAYEERVCQDCLKMLDPLE